MQVSVIVVALAVLSLGTVDFGETYKGVRPYKYYAPFPWRPPRWHPPAKNLKRFRGKRRPPHKYRLPYQPDRHRYAPHYEDSVDVADDDKPYIIVIQLPRRKEKRKKLPYERVHVVEPSEYERETEYIDENEDVVDGDVDGYDDGKVKVYQLDDNKVQIKVNDRLSVLTS